MGLAVLPTAIATSTGGLVRVASAPALKPRRVWLVAHRDARKIPRVRAVMDAIEKDLRPRISAK